MGHVGRTGECLEMLPAKARNHSQGEDEINLCVPQIECLCAVYFQHYYLMLPHCHLGIVVSERGYLLEPDWLSSVEIRSLTSYVKTQIVVNRFSIQLVISNAAEYR